MFIYKSPTFLLDASGKTQSRQLNELTSKVLTAGAGISLKILGSNELARGIHSGKTATINWRKEDLQDLARHSLSEGSNGKYESLRALSHLELRGDKVSPEVEIINTMIERNRVTPGILVVTINNLLWETAKSGQKMTRDLFNRQLEKI